MIIELFINEKKIQAETTPDQMLLDFLREQGYKSMKRGCDTGNCGLCTVWMDEKPVFSCSIPAVRAAGHKITTIRRCTGRGSRIFRLSCEGRSRSMWLLQSGNDNECTGIKTRDSESDNAAGKGIFSW